MLLFVLVDELAHKRFLLSVIGVFHYFLLLASRVGANLFHLRYVKLVVNTLVTNIVFSDTATAPTIPYSVNMII